MIQFIPNRLRYINESTTKNTESWKTTQPSKGKVMSLAWDPWNPLNLRTRNNLRPSISKSQNGAPLDARFQKNLSAHCTTSLDIPQELEQLKRNNAYRCITSLTFTQMSETSATTADKDIKNLWTCHSSKKKNKILVVASHLQHFEWVLLSKWYQPCT